MSILAARIQTKVGRLYRLNRWRHWTYYHSQLLLLDGQYQFHWPRGLKYVPNALFIVSSRAPDRGGIVSRLMSLVIRVEEMHV